MLRDSRVFTMSRYCYRGAGYKTLLLAVYKTSFFFRVSEVADYKTPLLFRGSQVAVYKTLVFSEGQTLQKVFFLT